MGKVLAKGDGTSQGRIVNSMKEFVSPIREVQKVSHAAEGRGIFVLDRGGDRRSLYKQLLKDDGSVRFIIRQRGDRHLLHGEIIHCLPASWHEALHFE